MITREEFDLILNLASRTASTFPAWKRLNLRESFIPVVFQTESTNIQTSNTVVQQPATAAPKAQAG